MHAQHGWNADRQVQVRAALRQAELEERVDSCHMAPRLPGNRGYRNFSSESRSSSMVWARLVLSRDMHFMTSSFNSGAVPC